MPELPEVQTVCDVMRPQIVGKRIENIRIEEEKVIAGADVDKFKKCLIGAAFEAVNRRGKYILLLQEVQLQESLLFLTLREQVRFRRLFQI